MNINGENGLACLTKIPKDTKVTTVRPLPHMYVIKDLVTDMTNFYEQYASIKPWLQKKSKVDTNYEVENLQSYEDRLLLDSCSLPCLMRKRRSGRRIRSLLYLVRSWTMSRIRQRTL